MDTYFELFKNYINDNYNLSDPSIELKYLHTVRVVSLMKDLVKRLSLSSDEKRLATFIALFHDLGAFREIKENKKNSDIKYDHANSSNIILFLEDFIKNFPISEEEYEIVNKAVYNHNKYDISDDLTPDEKLFAMLIRDVDKIDNLKIVANEHLEFDSVPSETVLNHYYNQELIDIHELKSKSDYVIFYLAFYYQLYYPESRDILDETEYMEEFIHSIKLNEDDKVNQYLFDAIEYFQKDFLKRKK